jgi:polar amino acid transport system substrate-binding protein
MGLLAALQAAKSVKVGLANQPPYSGMNPDGSLTGLAPAVVKLIMGRLGVPKVEGVVATYGELIPGLQARRWDFVGACLTITQLRCAQVRFSDPIVLDGGSMVYLRGEVTEPPKTLAELGQRNLTVGVLTGGAHSQVASAHGVTQANLRQFPNDPALIDGLLAKRIQVVLGTYSGLKAVLKGRNIDVGISYPIADHPAQGSGPVFRPADTDLYDAFRRELRALKASKEFVSMSQEFGFDTPPELINGTAEQFCAEAR